MPNTDNKQLLDWTRTKAARSQLQLQETEEETEVGNKRAGG